MGAIPCKVTHRKSKVSGSYKNIKTRGVSYEKIQFETYKRIGGKWQKTSADPVTNEARVYESLARDLMAKKIHQCKWIKRIGYNSNYDGTCNIEVIYDSDVKAIYTVRAVY